MFSLELLTNPGGCPLRCPTCPKSVQSFSGSFTDQIVPAFQAIETMAGKYPTQISFTHDFVEALSLIKQYNISSIGRIGFEMKFPIDLSIYKKNLIELGEMFPGTCLFLGVTSKITTLGEQMVQDIIEIGKIAAQTKFESILVTLNSNSIPRVKFNTEIYFKDDLNLHDALSRALGKKAQIECKDSSDPNLLSYENHAFFQLGKVGLQISRRMLSPVFNKNEPSTMEYYKSVAEHDVRSGVYFTPETLVLSLTPIGVRVIHRSYDVNNPFMWISYKELFSTLNGSGDFKIFCTNVRKLIDVGTHLHLEHEENVDITEDRILYFAKLRSQSY